MPLTNACPRCASTLPEASAYQREMARCPACGATVRVMAFAAAFTAPDSDSTLATVPEEGSARCYYHDENGAEAPCSRCGRYMCGVCMVIFRESAYCASCISDLKEAKPRSIRPEVSDLFFKTHPPNYRVISRVLVIGGFSLLWVALTFAMLVSVAINADVNGWNGP